MCTAISINDQHHLFGRTLDLEYSFGENVIITPKNFNMRFLHQNDIKNHPAIIGIGCVADSMPLYYDAINSHGLAIAALNFPHYAVYCHTNPSKINIAAFEVIPFVLCNCQSAIEAKNLLQNCNITDDSFSERLKTSPLHWVIADKDYCFTLESTKDGIKLYDNPFGVLTNSPDFNFHKTNIANYLALDSKSPKNNLCQGIDSSLYSRGLGAIGLPGDYSSTSRFIRAVFTKNHASPSKNKTEQVNRFFHIMETVSVTKGVIKTDQNKDVCTIYTSCADTKELIYYYKTYSCPDIKSVKLTDNNIDSEKLIRFTLNTKSSVEFY